MDFSVELSSRISVYLLVVRCNTFIAFSNKSFFQFLIMLSGLLSLFYSSFPWTGRRKFTPHLKIKVSFGEVFPGNVSLFKVFNDLVSTFYRLAQIKSCFMFLFVARVGYYPWMVVNKRIVSFLHTREVVVSHFRDCRPCLIYFVEPGSRKAYYFLTSECK